LAFLRSTPSGLRQFQLLQAREPRCEFAHAPKVFAKTDDRVARRFDNLGANFDKQIAKAFPLDLQFGFNDRQQPTLEIPGQHRNQKVAVFFFPGGHHMFKLSDFHFAPGLQILAALRQGSAQPVIWNELMTLQDELRTRFDSKQEYAVRSSGIAEDSAEHSFAGMFETYLNVSIDTIVSLKLNCCRKSKNFSNGLKNPTGAAQLIKSLHPLGCARRVLLSAGDFLFGCGLRP
jgi:hypothetical protein